MGVFANVRDNGSMVALIEWQISIWPTINKLIAYTPIMAPSLPVMSQHFGGGTPSQAAPIAAPLKPVDTRK